LSSVLTAGLSYRERELNMGYVEVDPKEVPKLLQLGYRQAVIHGRVVLIPPDEQKERSLQKISDKLDDTLNEVAEMQKMLKEFYKTYLKDRMGDERKRRRKS
jgi:hypothetical protein